MKVMKVLRLNFYFNDNTAANIVKIAIGSKQ